MEHALADYDQAIKLDPNDASPYVNRGLLLQRTGKTAQGINDMTAALKLDAKDATILLNRALLYLSINMYDRAVDDLSEAIKLNPKYADAYINRGYCYHMKKQYRSAIKDFDEAIPLAPFNALAFSNRGNAYTALRDTTGAVGFRCGDPPGEPRCPTVHEPGQCLRSERRPSPRRRRFQPGDRVGPRLHPAFRNRGHAYLALGETDKARLDFAVAQELEPAETAGIPKEFLTTK